jgi:hypothetical protein
MTRRIARNDGTPEQRKTGWTGKKSQPQRMELANMVCNKIFESESNGIIRFAKEIDRNSK